MAVEEVYEGLGEKMHKSDNIIDLTVLQGEIEKILLIISNNSLCIGTTQQK